MESEPSSSTTASSHRQHHRGSKRGYYRGRRGRGRGTHNERNSINQSHIDLPASSSQVDHQADITETSRPSRPETPSSSATPRNGPLNSQPPVASGDAISQSRPRRRGRGGGIRGAPTGPARSNFESRQPEAQGFARELTRDTTDNGASSSSGLNAKAVKFQPGTKYRPSARPPPQNRATARSSRSRGSRSTAMDMTTRIHDDIDNLQYECAVCTNEVQRSSRIWSCKTCWAVFHLHCIKKWSASASSTVTQGQQLEDGTELPRRWRCPGCNLPQEVMPDAFTCWCGKEMDPRSYPGLPPFSCGQTCSRPHVLPRQCPHPCSSICHAGPCPQCSLMGPSQSCFCGRNARTQRCVDTPYEHGWSCGQVCNELMPCGEHFCGKPCHDGLCGACEVPIEARCYCGKVRKQMLCDAKDQEKDSVRKVLREGEELEIDTWVGMFSCMEVCGRPFDCGKHTCQKRCHPQDLDDEHCHRSPEVVSCCPCGKTSLTELEAPTRTSCEDDIPLCSKPCLKSLPCGHKCQQVCHTGDCQICTELVGVPCRCGRTTTELRCFEATSEDVLCDRICRAKLSCSRHECGERCCSGEKKAADRISLKKKFGAIPNYGPEGFEPEHICTRVCGRPLKCGTHNCPELCHRGTCNTCREAIFEEISCHCGRTVLQPPLPCGTQPPPCRFECERPKTCGHPQVSHNCHLDNEDCPKCPFLTTKSCLCGKNQVKNQPCWLTSVRCGEVCGKKLKCGFHRCQKTCHGPGECEDAGRACQQTCGKEKTCSHPCSEKCHSPSSCKEDKPCQHKIFITCPCQRIKQEVKCYATKGATGNSTKTLTCDDECLRLERNRKLQLAFDIDPAVHQDDHIPYSADCINMYLENPSWAQAQEKLFRAFAANPDEKRLRFKPMRSHQRAFLHALAEDFGFDSESMDPEPHRHVALFKTPRFVMSPMKTLADCVRIRQMQQLVAAPGRISGTEELASAVKAGNLVGDPFNAFLLTAPRFALTSEELYTALATCSSPVSFEVFFVPSDEVILRPKQQSTWQTQGRRLETSLSELKREIAKVVSAQPDPMGVLQLCRVDDSLNVVRRETDRDSKGWSQVAARAAAAPVGRPKYASNTGGIGTERDFGSQNQFVVLSTTAKRKGKGKSKAKDMEEEVVENWEDAERAAEEHEQKDVSSVDYGSQ